MRIQIVSESALLITFAQEMSADVARQVSSAQQCLQTALGEQLIDVVPSYASLLLIFDPGPVSAHTLRQQCWLALRGDQDAAIIAGTRHELPVYYDRSAGADLDHVARHCGLDTQEVIARHSGRDYQVYAIGFAPGFAYLGELDAALSMPRHASPRPAVPAGSVAIADRQTAVYPGVSPGGWHLLGRCPVPLFDADATPPARLRAGDTVRFTPIARADYLALGGEL